MIFKGRERGGGWVCSFGPSLGAPWGPGLREWGAAVSGVILASLHTPQLAACPTGEITPKTSQTEPSSASSDWFPLGILLEHDAAADTVVCSCFKLSIFLL